MNETDKTATVNVIPLKTHTQAAREDTVEMLEKALERARAGEIVSAAVCYVTADGGIGTGISESLDVGRLIGACAYLQHRLCVGAE